MISSRLRNRALGYLWVAGALLDVVTVLLPDPGAWRCAPCVTL